MSFQMVNFHKQRAITPICTIIELEEEIMILKNVTKFHKILIKTIQLREWTSLGMMYIQTQTGVTLNTPAIVMVGV